MSGLKKKIYVTHVNIRLSISFLLMKLVCAEFVAGALIVAWLWGLMTYMQFVSIMQNVIRFGFFMFSFLVLIKAFIVVFIILQWLNEYYEISADMIKYRRGILFRNEDEYPTSDIKYIDVEQGPFGRLLNFGTITLFNIRRVQLAQMYLIHNPLRYAKVIEEIVPGLVERKHVIRRHFYTTRNHEIDTNIT